MTEQNQPLERNLGEQPIARILADENLTARDLVKASPLPITHKMVARACKGRRLTKNSQNIVQAALQAASGKTYRLTDLFTYR